MQPARPPSVPWLITPLIAALPAPAARAAQGGGAAGPPAPPPPCAGDPAYALLDFWVGDWDVLWKGEKVGSNRIEKTLAGCAVEEHWRDARGGEGFSLFYFQPVLQVWRQVWVTDRGPMKEKRLVGRYPDGGVRFQGELPRPGGELVLDRTTLTPQPDGTVRQLIEQSEDGGATWVVGFDAVYVRRPPALPREAQ